MKKITVLFLGCILFSAIAFVSCNKNSLQLPVPDKPRTFSINASLNNINKIKVRFTQPKYEVEGNTTLRIKNLTGEKITDLQLLISTSDTNLNYVNYDNLQRWQLLAIDVLSVYEEYEAKLNYPLKNIESDSVKTSVEIISINSAEKSYSKVYSSQNTEFYKGTINDKSNGFVNGFVAADGKCIMYMKYEGSYYSFRGTFPNDETLIDGQIDYADKQSAASVDSINNNPKLYYKEDTLIFKIKLEDKLGTDSISSILFNLIKF